MKINSINSVNSANYMTQGTSFKHSAVPYPEYEYAYHNNRPSAINRFVNKLSELFTPEITTKSKKIKADINRIYDAESQVPDFIDKEPAQKHLLSVFA